MKLDDVLREVIEQLGSGSDDLVGWEQVRHWPDGAALALESKRWIKPAATASQIECPGCEENCFMPVQVYPGDTKRAPRALVACDQRGDIGRVKIPMSYLQQWQIDDDALACWIAQGLKLNGKPQRQSTGRAFTLGTVQGRDASALMEFDVAGGVQLKAAGRSVLLREVLYSERGEPRIDQDAVLSLVELSHDATAMTANMRRDPSKSGDSANAEATKWHKQLASKAANARHDRPGGSRDKQRQIREIWASGKYSSRDICAEQEAAELGMSFTTARKALKGTPEPSRS